ncbi:MAG: energy transducer TonB [bacterium]|nr:energy transducer TonB [bacterium]
MAIHFAAVAWMGVNYAPENAREAEPVVMWLEGERSSTRPATHSLLSSVAQAKDDGDGWYQVPGTKESGDRSREKGDRGVPTEQIAMVASVEKERSAMIDHPAVLVETPAEKEPVLRESEASSEAVEQVVSGTDVKEELSSQILPDGEPAAEDPAEPGGTGAPVEDATGPVETRTSTIAVQASAEGVEPESAEPITDRLAFAGDPAHLGMMMDEALYHAYVQAEPVVFNEPEYPLLSRRRGEEGRVVITVQISAKGEVRSAKVVSSSNYERLDRAALAVVEQASFSPATKFGMPVVSERMLAYRFRLTEQ